MKLQPSWHFPFFTIVAFAQYVKIVRRQENGDLQFSRSGIQLTFICSNSAIESLEKGVKYAQS